MIAGIGFRDSARLESLLDALARAGAGACRRIALPAAKARHPAARALEARGHVLILIEAAALAGIETLTESPAARTSHGTGSVSEACALAAAGPGAALTGPRAISADRRATAAVALTQGAAP